MRGEYSPEHLKWLIKTAKAQMKQHGKIDAPWIAAKLERTVFSILWKLEKEGVQFVYTRPYQHDNQVKKIPYGMPNHLNGRKVNYAR